MISEYFWNIGQWVKSSYFNKDFERNFNGLDVNSMMCLTPIIRKHTLQINIKYT